jgi:tetratricopeptide (TPR) repeat protein
VLQAVGEFGEAASRFRLAVESSPEWLAALQSLALLLATAPDAAVRNPSEAVNVAERAAKISHRRDAAALDVLGVAHGSAGDFDRALTVIDESLALNPPTPLAATIRAHQEMFKRGQVVPRR